MAKRELILVGSSHRLTPLNLLESLSLTRDEIRERLPGLKEDEGLDEVVLLSTCNRTEIYAASREPDRIGSNLEQWLAGLSRGNEGIGSEHVYVKRERDVVDHLLRTTCGLESLMVGETEIAGQVQDAFELAREIGTAGSFLTQLFSATFHASKRARTETDISAGTTSVASASVHLAHRIFGDLSRRSILVVGACETGRLLSRHFKHQGARELFIANRTIATAQNVAKDFCASAVSLDGIVQVLPLVDVVVCATSAKAPLIEVGMVVEAMKSRGSRMLLIVDISLPHNVEPEVGDLNNVFLNDMNDLRTIVDRSLRRREKEIPAVEDIIGEEADAFFARQSTLEVGPLIKELRRHYESLGDSEIERFAGKFSEEDLLVARRMVGDLMNKLLHWPTLEIRSMARESNPERIAWSRKLFGLDRLNFNGKGDRRR